MKKVIFSALIAGLMVGCSSDEPVDHAATGTPIEFRTITQKPTRVGITVNENLRDFKVFGNWTGYSASPGQTTPTGWGFMTGVNVVREVGGETHSDPDAWSYAPVHYFPKNAEIDFCAYSPAGSRGVTKAFEEGVIEYTVSEDAPLQEDFLVAATTGQTGENVVFTFKHALSLIEFQAKNNADDVIFQVTSINFDKMNGTGEFNMISQTWEPEETYSGNYSVAINDKLSIYKTPDSYIDLTGVNDGLVLLPQTLVDEEQVLTVTYSAWLGDGTVLYKGEKIERKLKDIIPNGEFKMGHKYVFRLDFSTGLTAITFAVDDVIDWTAINPPFDLN